MENDTAWVCLLCSCCFAIGGALGSFTADQGRTEQKRIAAALEAIAASQTFQASDYEQIEKRTRRNITHEEDVYASGITGCPEVVFIGYDNKVHPDWCRK